MTRLAPLLLLLALAPAASAAGADVGLLAVQAEPSPEPGCTVPLDDLCVATWDDAGTLAPGDDRVRSYQGLDTVAVIVRPPLGPGLGEHTVEPGRLRVEHPAAKVLNGTWPRLDAAVPAPLDDTVAFEARPSRANPARWGAFVAVAVDGEQPVLDAPLFGVEAGTCWNPCHVSDGGPLGLEDDAVRLFPRGIAGYDDTDAYLRWQGEQLLLCEAMAAVPGACLALDAAAPPTRTAMEAALAATPQVVGGWSVNRTTLGSAEGGATPPPRRGTAANAPAPLASSPAAVPLPTEGLATAAVRHETLAADHRAPAPAPDVGPGALTGATLVGTPARPAATLAVALAAAAISLVLAGALYSRIARHRALEQATRRRIHDAIAAQPGIRVGTLQNLLGLNYNTVLRHVRVLARCGLVEASGAGQRRYFVRGATSGVAARRAAIAADAPVAREVLRFVQHHGAVELPRLRKALGLPRSTASVALQRLAEAGWVEKHPGRGRSIVVRAVGPPQGWQGPMVAGAAPAAVQSTP